MKIAVFHNLPTGGALRSVEGWMRWLAPRHEVELYTLDSAAPFDWADPAGGASRPMVSLPAPEPSYWKRPLGLLNPVAHGRWLSKLDRVYRELARRIDAGGYGVVFVHPCRLVQAPALLAHLRTPSVYYCHEPSRRLYEPARRGEGALRGRVVDEAIQRGEERYDRRAFGAAGRVLVNSEFTRQAVARIYDRPATVLPPGVDTGWFAPDPTTARGDFALSVGAISPLKGYDLLIESLSRLPPDRRPPLVLVGDRASAGEPERLEALAADRGVRLGIREGLSEAALRELYRTARLFLYAPIDEPLGLTPLEAMACGLPVVGVAEGGVNETVVDQRTGLLTGRDPGALAAAIGALLSDEARYGELARQARDHVERRWSWGALGPKLETFLAEATEGRR